MNKEKRSSALIIDDDPSWQTLLKELVIDLGFDVEVASDIDQAESLLRHSPHRFAVVDLSLDINNHRNMDGFSILKKIKQHDPGCIPIMISGYANVEQAVKAIKDHGAYTCLHKEDFSRARFKQVVMDMLAESRPSQVRASGKREVDNKREHPAGADKTGEEKIKALVVEDDAGWRELISELLEDAGYETQVSGSFGEAIGHLGRNKYQLAVIDLSLDGSVRNERGKDFEGFRLLENCEAKGIPAIVVSGVGSVEEIEQIYEKYEISAFLEKQTFDRELFLQTIDVSRGRAQIDDELAVLTERELQVLTLLAKGHKNKEMAEKLMVSPNTIKKHIKAIYEKLGVRNRAEATAKAISSGLTN